MTCGNTHWLIGCSAWNASTSTELSLLLLLLQMMMMMMMILMLIATLHSVAAVAYSI